jgi:trypsin-like peptidase
MVDSKSNFYGTGFVIEIKQERYCITCHHCICRLKEIYIERDNVNCSTKWIEELSDMGKDIAVLKVIGCSNVKPLKYAKEAMAQLSVSLWGYSVEELEIFPQGAPAKKGSLSDAPILFQWPEEKENTDQKWNKKPEVNVYVFQYDGKFHLGNSGAPVCYTGNNNVVGVFTAKDDNYGWVIPIQTILEKFEDKKVAEPSPSLDMASYIEKGNKNFIKEDYYDAIKLILEL